MTTAVTIFVKTPGHSPVKTRLAETIGVEAAAEFHLLAAAAVAEVAGAAQARDATLQPCWAVAECDALDASPWRAFPRLWQGDGGLGERLDRIYAAQLAVNDQVLLIGADAPQLTPALLCQAGTALDDPATPFAIGEAGDGGFWLFGGRASVPREVWCRMTYSRHDTALQLRHALHGRGGIAALPVLTDADRPADLWTLTRALAALPSPLPAQRILLQWLQQHLLPSDESFSLRRPSLS